MSPICSVY